MCAVILESVCVLVIIISYNNLNIIGFMPTRPRNRKSKWDPDLNPTMIPGFPRILPQGLQKEQLDALLGM